MAYEIPEGQRMTTVRERLNRRAEERYGQFLCDVEEGKILVRFASGRELEELRAQRRTFAPKRAAHYRRRVGTLTL
jgi:hypothetical protein